MTRSHPVLMRYALRVAFVLVFAFLLYAGLRQNPVPELFHEEDKLYHLIGFAAFIACARLAFPRGAWWWQTAGALALGAGIELAQNLQPARTGSIWDFLFDAVGVGLGLLLLRLPVFQRLDES
ncbi:MAG TPA: hypothetical protein VFL78_03415 [Rhodanobacteraceae bacterium]|nr:hypothetical protein [Rhodanobacteraceae bacterium]